MTSRMLFELLGFLLSPNVKVKKMTRVSAVMFEIVEMYIFQIHLHYFFFSVLYVKASPLSGEDFASPLNRYFSQITLTNRIYLYIIPPYIRMLSSDWLMKGVFFYQFFVFSAFPPLPGYFIEIYHACKWLGKFVQSLNQYFLANTTYKHGICL